MCDRRNTCGTRLSPADAQGGAVRSRTWWVAGLLTSVAQGAVWVAVGGTWWQLLGYWDTPAAALGQY